jgi:glycerol-3-phosphate responsive antiterminator
MPITRVNCPNCRQPFSAEITQLFDVANDPTAKQTLLSGAVNVAHCPHCGYQGPLSTPIVYHDPDKELLLTYIPPEVNLPRPEQERLLGGIIQQVVNRLPQEKRKAYILQPQAVLTLQGLVERILEADGITREMIDAQQQRIKLIQRLLAVPEESLPEAVAQDNELMDEDFFAILSRLVEASAAAGDRTSAQALVALQRNLLPLTEYGKEIQAQTEEIEAAMISLREIGSDLTREKLLQLFLDSPTDTRLGALVTMTRPGLDYTFFQMLSEIIDKSSGTEKSNLIELREKLLELTKELDEQTERRKDVARMNLETLLKVEDVESAVLQNMQSIDEYFVEAINQQLEDARTKGDLEKSAKLNQIMQVLQRASAPPELDLIEELIQLPDSAAVQNRLRELEKEITPEFLELLTGIISQMQNENDQETLNKLQTVYRAALKISMEANMKR